MMRLAIDALHHLPDAENAGIEVDILPAQAQPFAEPQAEQGGDDVGRFQLVALGGFKEGACLGRREPLSLDSYAAGRVREGGDLALDQVPFQRSVEGDAEHGADICDCRDDNTPSRSFARKSPCTCAAVRLPSSI